MCKFPEQVGEELLRRKLGIDLTYMQVQKLPEKRQRAAFRIHVFSYTNPCALRSDEM